MKTEINPERKDLLSTSVRNAYGYIANHDVKIRDGTVSFSEFDLAETIQAMPQKRGWARRRQHGKQYGTAFIAKYDERIREFFARGEEDTSAKMQPGDMLDQLRIDFPGCYSLPGENEIRILVSTLMQEKKEAEKNRKALEKKQAEENKKMAAALARGEEYNFNSDSSTPVRKKTVKFPSTYIPHIVKCVENDNKVKHSVVYESLKLEFIQDGDLPGDFPTGELVNKQVTYQKQKLKQINLKSLM